jgi:hypothetical protein
MDRIPNKKRKIKIDYAYITFKNNLSQNIMNKVTNDH